MEERFFFWGELCSLTAVEAVILLVSETLSEAVFTELGCVTSGKLDFLSEKNSVVDYFFESITSSNFSKIASLKD